LGDALLVAPVLEPGATARRALLPPGRWLELGTGRVHAGDAWADLEAPLGRPVWLLREGHALPLADVAIEADEVVPAWLAGRADAAPPPIRWLGFPDASGAVRGRLTWEDGWSRAFERGAVDAFELVGAAGAAPRLRRTAAGSGIAPGAHEAWWPAAAGDARLPWFDATWARAPLTVE
jgi:alpha-glucosidase